jgi:CubicO group peptidase (beta-lactamase class C family)
VAYGWLGFIPYSVPASRPIDRGRHQETSMTLKERADSLLSRAAQNGDVPGVVAMATNREGTIYESAFGQRALGQTPAMTADTVVWIASMTKAITSAGAMQLVERGALNLDAPAQSVVPAIAEAQVLTGFDAAGRPQTRAPKRPITLRHLLTHTAGFSYEFFNVDIQRYQASLGLPGITECKNASLTTPLLFDPGERWEYGINIDWAGKMIEAVSAKKLGAYLHENLFAPLGMDSIAFRITPSMRARLAKIHQRGDDYALTPLDLEMTQEPEFEAGGGGLYGTAGDYLKFVRMILNGGAGNGERVLRPETVELMALNNMGDNRVGRMKTAIPALSNDVDLFPGMPKTWGLSFMINTQRAATGRSAGSLMWAGLANSYYWIDRSTGVGGVYLTQILPFADKKSYALFEAFETAVYDSLR